MAKRSGGVRLWHDYSDRRLYVSKRPTRTGGAGEAVPVLWLDTYQGNAHDADHTTLPMYGLQAAVEANPGI